MDGHERSLADFLLAQIAEDEAVVRNATPGHWHVDDTYSTVTADPFTSARAAYDRASFDADCWVVPESMDSGVGGHDLAHIARHDPARVLAECEAKRRTLEVAQLFGCANAVARYLALPYADHPDYREEWRP